MGWAKNDLALAHLVDATSQATSQEVHRSSLDFLLRYAAFSCTSYTTSSNVKISLTLVDATLQEPLWTSCYAMLLKYDQHAFICLCVVVALKVLTNTVEMSG